jgi:ribonuclease P protein component
LSTIDAFEIVPRLGTNAFPKDFRLRTAADFKKVYSKGAKRKARLFVVFALRNGLEYSRFGLTTPRKLGKAHVRNRLKRTVREILRTSRAAIPTGFDFVVNPRPSASDREIEELRRELLPLLGS